MKGISVFFWSSFTRGLLQQLDLFFPLLVFVAFFSSSSFFCTTGKLLFLILTLHCIHVFTLLCWDSFACVWRCCWIRGSVSVESCCRDSEGFSLAPPSLTGRSRVATGSKNALFPHIVFADFIACSWIWVIPFLDCTTLQRGHRKIPAAWMFTHNFWYFPINY